MSRQAEYHNYVYELIHTTQNNPRFSQLTQYFSTLEKVTALESEASAAEIHKLKSADIVDFDTWRSMRKKEKAQDELDGLLGDLRHAQKEREFHFRPKEVESVRWTGDSRLRCRDKSVENLKSLFTQKIADAGEESPHHLSSTSLNKDNYRLYWRPQSASDLTRRIETETSCLSAPPVSSGSTYPRTRHAQSPYVAAVNSLTQQRSRSSLSTDQVSTLKNQLNNILSAKTSAASSVQSSRSPSRAEQYSIEVKAPATQPLQSLGLFVKPVPELVLRSQEQAAGGRTGRQSVASSNVKPRSRSTEQEERLRISKTIQAELLKKVNFRDAGPAQEPR